MDIELQAIAHFLWLKGDRNPDIHLDIEDVHDHGTTTVRMADRGIL
jgi:hypothetical protein